MPLLELEASSYGASAVGSTHVEQPTCAEGHRTSQSPPDDDATQAPLPQEVRWVQLVRQELDDYLISLRQLNSCPVDEVFIRLSGITSRLAELRIHCCRSESRRLAALRSREIDPLIEECDRQFRIHSRLQAVRAMEFSNGRFDT